MTRKFTLKQIWDEFSKPTFSYLVVKDKEGQEVFIEGYRPPDSEGGCMSTGTPGALYGRTPNNEHWYHYPKPKTSESPSWTFVKGKGECFYVRDLETGEVCRGLEEGDGGFTLLKNGQKVSYPKDRFERIPTSSICLCCLKKIEKKKSHCGKDF